MYRKLPNNALKPYYYRVAHGVLYVYRHEEDKEFKSLIYIGHSHEVKPLRSEFQKNEKDEEIYGIELISPHKRRVFYILGEHNFTFWKGILLKATN